MGLAEIHDALNATLVLLVPLTVLGGFVVGQHRTARRQAAQFTSNEVASQENARRLATTLAYMDQGLMMIDSDGIVVVCNDRVRTLLGLPDTLEVLDRSFDDLVRWQWESDEFAQADLTMVDFVQAGGIARCPPIYERQRPNGNTIEIRTTRLEHGGYVRTYTDISQRRAAEQSIRVQAVTDDLTGLANRPTFRRHLESALDRYAASSQGFALLYMDLDRFKPVNDTHGHKVGDELLVAVAQRLRGQARVTDTLGRLGGDEFALIATQVDGREAAEHLAVRLIASIAKPFEIDGRTLEIGVSIGVAVQASGGACTPEALLHRADLALYQAKNEGRSVFRIDVAG